MGRSGSGKSTLMHCLAGLDTLTSGRILIGDTDLGRLDDKHLTQLRRDRVGFIFQSFNLVPTLTAAENIALPAALAGRRSDRQWVDTVIDAVGLRDRLGFRPGRAVGWAAAAGGGRPGAGVGAGDRVSPTNRPATWTRGPAARSWTFCGDRCRTSARPS